MTKKTPTTDIVEPRVALGEVIAENGNHWRIIDAKSGAVLDDNTLYGDDSNTPQTPGAIHAPRNLRPKIEDTKG